MRQLFVIMFARHIKKTCGETEDRGRRTARGGMREIDHVMLRQPRIGVAPDNGHH